LQGLRWHLNNNIDSDSIKIIDRVQSAIKSLKPNKRDSFYDGTSDMYRNSPPNFSENLAKILRQSFIHIVLPDTVLLCTLMPLIKDNLDDITRSDNYRAIAGGCLLLKVLDLVILSIEGDKLSTDTLQACKQNTGTSTCTWMVTAIVDNFTRDGNAVYGAALDMSKTFGMVQWTELFETLLNHGIGILIIRLLLFIYTNQQFTV